MNIHSSSLVIRVYSSTICIFFMFISRVLGRLGGNNFFLYIQIIQSCHNIFRRIIATQMNKQTLADPILTLLQRRTFLNRTANSS